MHISYRPDKPWDGMFIFHFLCSDASIVPNEIRRALQNKEKSESETVFIQNKEDKCQIAGRFYTTAQCSLLIQEWNKPEGDLHFMCFSPNHGMATINNNRRDWCALICFQCANAWIGETKPKQNKTGKIHLLPSQYKENGGLEELFLRLLPERPFDILS